MSTALLLLSIRHFLSLSCIPVWATECVRLRVGQGAQQAGRNSKEKDLIFSLKQETYVDPKKKREKQVLYDELVDTGGWNLEQGKTLWLENWENP